MSNKLKAWFLGSRKFLVMLGLLLLAGVFRAVGLLESKDFADLLSAVGVAFMGANTVENMAYAVKDWLAAKASHADKDESK